MNARPSLRSGAAALVAVCTIVSFLAVGPAGAKQPVDVDVEYGSANCGTHIDGIELVGTASFKATGNKIKLDLAFTGVDVASTSFDVTVWGVEDDDSCTQLGGVVGSFSTDASGDGTFSAKKVNVSGYDTVFARATATDGPFPGITHTSLRVELP